MSRFDRPHSRLTISPPLSLQLYLVSFSILTLNNIVTLKCGLEVTQDHSNLYYSKAWVRFTILYCCLSNAMHRQNINLSVCVCLCVCVHHTFCQLAYRSDPSTDFYSWYLKRRGFTQGCAFWGFWWWIITFRGPKSPKTPIFGARIGISSQN